MEFKDLEKGDSYTNTQGNNTWVIKVSDNSYRFKSETGNCYDLCKNVVHGSIKNGTYNNFKRHNGEPTYIPLILQNTKIEVLDADQSRLVQQLAFSQGFRWLNNELSLEYRNLYAPYIYFSGKTIMFGSNLESFALNHNKEIKFEDLINKIKKNEKANKHYKNENNDTIRETSTESRGQTTGCCITSNPKRQITSASRLVGNTRAAKYNKTTVRKSEIGFCSISI